MKHWLYPTNVKNFRIHDWLSEHDFIDYKQPKSMQINDIVYLYCTLPEARIAYKMVVERINVPYEETIDDTDYALIPSQTNEMQSEYLFCRLRKVAYTESNLLSLSNLRILGFRSCVQSAQKAPEKLIPFIEDCFGQK